VGGFIVMADVTYESLEGKIETQRGVIQQQRIAGERGIQSLRRVHPRTPPGVWFGERKPKIETIKGQLGELESAEKELSEHEQIIAQRKAEGYKIRETDEGKIEFYKEVYTPGERVQVGVRKQGVKVYWRSKYKNTEGEYSTGSFVTLNVNLADACRQLEAMDRYAYKTTTIGGGEPIYKEKEGFWTTKDVILWEGTPIVKEPTKTLKQILGYITLYEKIPESIVKKRVLPTPSKFAEARGYTIDQRATYDMTPEIQFLLKYADPEEKRELQRAFESGPVTVPEGTMGPVHQPIYPAFQKAYASLSPGEKTGFAEQFPGSVKTVEPTPYSKLVTERYGTERWDIYVAKHAQNLGLPTLIAGVQTITGQDPKAWGRLHEQYAAEILESTRRPGESLEDYSARFFTSPQAIMNIYLPIATLGAGYIVKPYLIGLKTITPASKVFPITSRIAYYGAKYHKAIVAGTVGAIGGVTAYQVYKEPEAAPLIIGRTAAGFVKMYAGYQVGGKLYTSTHSKIIQESYWTGTAYEQAILDSWHKQAVLSSEYKPYECGTPAARYTAMIRPAWQKFPYVPKTPIQMQTKTLGIRDPSDPYRGFYIKKHVLSSRDFATYETSPVIVDVAGKDYTFSTFSGEVTFKGATRRVIGFGRGQYVGDMPDDIMVSRMYGYSVTDATRPTIIRGTALHKTYYGGGAEWTGKGIKFFTPSKEYDVTIGFSFGRARGMEAFDVSSVVKPSIQAKSYFGDPGGFDYGLPTKLIDDVIMPGGMPMESGFKISLKSPFDALIDKPTRFVDVGFYDAGIISSYWKDVSPAAVSIPTMANIQKIELASISSSMQKIGTVPMIKTIQADVHISRDIQSQFTVPVSISKSLSSSISAQESVSSSMTAQLQQQMQLTEQLSITALTQITPQISVTPVITPTVPMPTYYQQPTVTPTTETPPPPPPPFIFGALPRTAYDIVGKRVRGQGFYAEVRERHYFKQKQTKEGKYVKVSKRPLIYSDAKALMGMALDKSAAASGRVVPTDKPAQKPLIKLDPFENIEHKFYMKDNVFIEKPKYRIDTRGEVKGVSALSWYAEKTAKAAKKREVVARRPRARVVKERDMFDTGMDDMLINMDKIFKGAFDFGF